MNRRELLAGAAKFAGILGTVGSVGKLLEHGSDDRVPLFATFVVSPEYAENCELDVKAVEDLWSRAFNGKPPCPIICLVGGEIRLHYKEPTYNATTLPKEDWIGHRITNVNCPLFGIPEGTSRWKEQTSPPSESPEYEVDWTKCKCGRQA